ncbi:MAG: hypothetical protein ACFBSE_18225, partial [Prochloraceae cyanobacterium]
AFMLVKLLNKPVSRRTSIARLANILTGIFCFSSSSLKEQFSNKPTKQRSRYGFAITKRTLY